MRGRFFIWDPFERGRWMELPRQPSVTDKILAALFICQGESRQCSIVLLCQFEGSAVLQIYTVEANQWHRTITSLRLTADENVPLPGVHCENFVYFYTSTKKIVRIDMIQAAADIIDLPQVPCLTQTVLSKINGLLSCATGDLAQVCVAQYQNDHWQLRWKCRAPRAPLWVNVVGSAEENGLLLVETSPNRLYILDVQDASWILLQQQLPSDIFFPLELNNPFSYPFPPALKDPSNLVNNNLSVNVKKDMNSRKILARRYKCRTKCS